MSGRIYKVTMIADPKAVEHPEFLVKSISPKRAQKHVAGLFITAQLAEVSDLARLMSEGKKILDGMPKAPDVPGQAEAPLENGDE